MLGDEGLTQDSGRLFSAIAVGAQTAATFLILFGRDLQIRKVSTLSGITAPDRDSPSSAVMQFLDHHAWFRRVVDEYAYGFSLDDDLRAKPRIAIRRRHDRLLILTGLLTAKLRPRPLRMGNVLDRVSRVFWVR